MATKKKRARRKGSTSQSQRIRDYVKKHPQATAAEVSKALGVSPALVYNVKSSNKNGSKSRRKKPARRNPVSRKKSVAAKRASSTDMLSLHAAAELIEAAGSIDQAREALSQIESLGQKLAGKV